MTTNLILQGLSTQRSDIDRIAELAGGSRIVALTENVYRVEDVRFSEALKAGIDGECFNARLDYAFTPAGRRLDDFGLVAMDMDSTLITIECIDEIADMQGLKPQVAEITEAAMRGEIEFRESLTRRVALLKGLEASALQRVYDERLKLSPGAERMLEAIKAAGLKTLLVSGGFTFFTDRMKTRLGLDYTHSNELEVSDGKLTGRVTGGIVDAEEKMRTVERVCADIGISPRKAIIMGDGANDLKMMGISGMSVAFRAKPIVRAQADVALNFVGLDGILSLFE
ncbi:phosphoserine phosphatase SerB [Noviherbaspirillum sp. CPCC 100848]|uniref:Phosphoserine phosphatase n=1 Tax=Noviherbaspirillum album TaxID=3080276 RepID=A0ABU6J778_9BURK|nr:phosphoserine phosphatase SerB [Noviherbaspirillum sp. CPCC 100848]MEC4719483.1 phosphoserine phosphatase SerB [Noviherbaspirillum sp. CPCC 100848]